MTSHASLTNSERTQPRRFHFEQHDSERLTHYLFRYPAKFHPPVARSLIETFSRPGDLILDPFCGSGTLLVEALPLRRRIIGLDLDPVAAFVSRAKILPVSAPLLRVTAEKLLSELVPFERSAETYAKLTFQDISPADFQREISLNVLTHPPIPNLFHWFRRYVIVDLAVIKREIARLKIPSRHRRFLQLCYASIIRNSSNADPVPVSGLEVTSHMLARDKRGRKINPFALMKRAVSRALKDWAEYDERVGDRRQFGSVRRGNATQITKHIRTPIDVVITSPPYHNAVDYYRRHTLEMYWLDLVASPEARSVLRPHYIGRGRVAKSNPLISTSKLTSSLALEWERTLAAQDPQRARDFKHYICSMARSVTGVAGLLQRGARAVFVVGKNSWNGYEIPTADLFTEITAPQFRLLEQYWYPTQNRYMTYSRRNNANIDMDYVLVYERL